MGPDLIAQNIIDELEVFCPVEDCPWVVIYSLNQGIELFIRPPLSVIMYRQI